MDDWETKSDENPPNPMELIGVSDYLRHHIFTGKGEKMFEYVYPPILGTREVIVSHEHASEATSFIKQCHGTLAKMMNEAAIQSVFKYPTAVKQLALKPAWKPFQKTRDVPEAITTKQINHRNGPKRGSNTTYLTVASKQKIYERPRPANSAVSTASSRTNTLTVQKSEHYDHLLQGLTDRLSVMENDKKDTEKSLNERLAVMEADKQAVAIQHQQLLTDHADENRLSTKRRNPETTAEFEKQISDELTTQFNEKMENMENRIDKRLEGAVNHLRDTEGFDTKLHNLERTLETKMVNTLKEVDKRLTFQIKALDDKTQVNHDTNASALDRLLAFFEEDKIEKKQRQSEMAHIKENLRVLRLNKTSDLEESDSGIYDAEDDDMNVATNESHDGMTEGIPNSENDTAAAMES